jgi:CP family cyanate transporter-like MFS transporter
VAVLWISFPLGLILQPGSWLLWGFLGGIAQGGGITIVFMLVVQLALTGEHARRLSAMVQGLGYALGATAPAIVGGLHDATGGWMLAIGAVLIATVVFAVSGFTGAVRATGLRGRP